MSDIKRLNNVGLRFLQLILIILFSKIIGIEIQTTKIDFVDQILSYEYINIIFVTFCLMVLINGGNFIDGLNGLMLKYYILIFLVIFFYFGYHPGIDKNFFNKFYINFNSNTFSKPFGLHIHGRFWSISSIVIYRSLFN